MLRGSRARERWTWLPLNVFYEIILTPIYKRQNLSILQNNKGLGNRLDTRPFPRSCQENFCPPENFYSRTNLFSKSVKNIVLP